MKRKRSRKIFALLLALVMILSLVACSNQDVSDDASFSDDAQSEHANVEGSNNQPPADNKQDKAAEETASSDVVTEAEDPTVKENTVSSDVQTPAPDPEQEHTHSYTSKVVWPTCTTDGYTQYTCSCGDSYNGDFCQKLTHLYSEKVVSPTATSQGYTKYTCIHCGDTYNSNYTSTSGSGSTGNNGSSNNNTPTIPSTPSHTCNYVVESVVPGTCTTKGYTVYACSCGDSYKDDYNGGKGHTWEDVYEEVEVYETVVVTRCGYCHANLGDVGGVTHIEWEALTNNVARSYQAVDQVYVGTEVQIVGSRCSVCGVDF